MKWLLAFLFQFLQRTGSSCEGRWRLNYRHFVGKKPVCICAYVCTHTCGEGRDRERETENLTPSRLKDKEGPRVLTMGLNSQPCHNCQGAKARISGTGAEGNS